MTTWIVVLLNTSPVQVRCDWASPAGPTHADISPGERLRIESTGGASWGCSVPIGYVDAIRVESIERRRKPPAGGTEG